MYTVKNASIYSMNGEMVYELNYNHDYSVRTVVSKDRFIRFEILKNGVWTASGKPYVVAKNKKRGAERIREAVIQFLAE